MSRDDARRLLLVWMAAAVSTAQAAPLSNGAFTVRDDRTLQVALRDVVLIADDHVNYLERTDQAVVQTAQVGNAAVLNVIQDAGDTVQFRKEVALHPDGRLELTVRLRLLPYCSTPDKPEITYAFRVPARLLDGAAYTARIGRAHSAETVTGTVSAAAADGSLTPTKCRFIAFQKGDLRLVIDANPYGVMSLQDYCMYGEPVGAWNIGKQGEHLVFSFGQTARFYGGIFTAKIILSEGPFDYEQRHPYGQWSYNGPTPASQQFTFGTAAAVEGFAKADSTAYTAAQGWGWRDAAGLATVTGPSPAILDNCVASPDGSRREFLVDVSPGVYLLTLRLGHPTLPLGPFGVALNGSEVLPAASLAPGQTREVLLSHYVRAPERHLVVGLAGSGPWAVHSLVVHPVISASQDFALDRGLWVAPGRFDPDVPLGWCGRSPVDGPATAPALPRALVAGEWQQSAAGATEGRTEVQSRPEVLLPPDREASAWRYDARMGDLTGGCGCLLYELYTPELIERRLAELAAGGINTVLISGLHMHHCFLDRWPTIVAYVQNVTELAHRRQMKVIFHHDVPVVLYNGTGLQHLLAHPDWLARDLRFGRPTLRSYCIMNPGFRAQYLERMVGLVRDTGIDGGMLDEGCFPGKDFCGCEYCRAAFTADTGLVLPRADTSTTFGNVEDPVWIAWVNWRRRAVGDFWVAFRRAINAVNPQFCNMKYTTHSGFTSNWAVREFGADLIDNARACDFLGTEIMSRNVYDASRAVFAHRRLKSALGDLYGLPVWGLVYHVDDPIFAYVGWAMNHMNRQTTWMSTIAGEDMRRYVEWPGRMDCRRASSVADVAVVFSAQSRDWTRMFSASTDPLGVSECLTDAHVQHDFILDQDLLDKGTLHRFKLVVLPSTGCLSRRQVETLRDYVAEGGALLASTNASLLDERGFLQPNFGLADVFGVDYDPAATLRGPLTWRDRGGAATLAYPGAALRVKPRQDAGVLADFLNRQGEPAWPALVTHRFGRGQAAYLPVALGAQNYESEGRAGGPVNFAKDKALAERLVRLVRETARAPLDFQAVALPEGVLTSVCRQTREGRNEVLVHLLNATGAGVAKGTVMPARRDWQKTPAFPPLPSDLCFELQAPALRRGHIASPDYAGTRPVEVVPQGDQRVRVTVKAADLVAYAIVRLTAE